MSTIEHRASPFDSIRYEDGDGEYWYARELGELMTYTWRHFNSVVNKARTAMAGDGYDVREHFRVVMRPAEVSVGKATKTSDQGGRPSTDYRMTRRACYFAAMNGDVKKESIRQAQTYFVERTLQAERVEEVLRTPQAPQPMPTHIEALRGWANALEALEAQEEATRHAEALVRELRPPAEAWWALAAAGGDCSVPEAAAILNRDPGIEIGSARLFRWLREIKIVFERANGQLVPYQRHMEHVRMRPTPSGTELRITPHGLEWILQRLRQEQARPVLSVVPDQRADVVALNPRT